MNPAAISPERFRQIVGGYSRKRIALIGDFCLDRYLEIDPAREETSIETGLPVHNVVRVRSQPGGAGTILNNLVALGVGQIVPVALAGRDGEGFELRQTLKRLPGVELRHFVQTATRRTFTYTKPLLMAPGGAPRELNRLDIKNWSPTPRPLRRRLARAVKDLAAQVDAFILLNQVDHPDTGVVTRELLQDIGELVRDHPKLLVIADSRQSLRDYPAVSLKMNRQELAALTGGETELDLAAVKNAALALARQQTRPVFVTLAEHGIVGASPAGQIEQVPIHDIRGPIDVVGAGDAVTANLAAALAAGASLREALVLANAAASIVIHQLGTTGTASPQQIQALLTPRTTSTP